MCFNPNYKREKARSKRWSLSFIYNPYSDYLESIEYVNKLAGKEDYSIFKTKGSKNELFFVVRKKTTDWSIFYDKCILFNNKL